ncbi:MAG: DNA gyrase inhibitor YacG [Planctomycetota bacterium]
MSKRSAAVRPSGQRCRHCRKPITPAIEHFPFCSDRCRTADLAKWATERYVISRPIEEADLDEGE